MGDPGVRSITAAFDPTDNGITPLRLALALLVLYSHSFVAGGYGFDPLYDLTGGQMQLGTVAVISFFGLSGFLLARSRASSSLVAYLRNRLLRIVPGLWVCIAATASVGVPLAVALGGRASPEDVTNFVLRAATFQLPPATVEGLFPNSGLPSQVNAPLWTLPPEMMCYLALGAIGLASTRAVPVFLVSGFGIAAIPLVATNGTWPLFHLPVAFLVGALLSHHAARVPFSGRLAAGLLALMALSSAAGRLGLVAPLVLPYIAIWAGQVQPLRWRRDLSYGTYIYAWPVQQLLAAAGLTNTGWLPYLATTVTVVLLVALLSALLVEEPALRLRSRQSRSVVLPSVSG